MKNYQLICPQGTKKKDREKYNIGDIYFNIIQCLICGEYLWSTHRHDFVTCSCGSTMCDGGSWYTKRCANDLTQYKELYIMYKGD